VTIEANIETAAVLEAATKKEATIPVVLDSVFIDESLVEDQAVRTLVGVQQRAWDKARGSSALALMVAEAYVAIRKIIANATAETQAAILDEHGVAPAENGTSQFTPWIKTYWGERHPDKTVTFKDGEGETRVVWVPDRNMEIYHHTMEELMARGVETTDAAAIAETIMASKGAATMAKERKKRLADLKKEAAAPVTENTRKLFLENTTGPMAELDFVRPEKAGKYMTILVRAVEGSTAVEVLGVVERDAIKALDKMADAAAPAIRARLDAEKKARAYVTAPVRESSVSHKAVDSVRDGVRALIAQTKARQAGEDSQQGNGEQAA